jgi:hypothetical protein
VSPFARLSAVVFSLTRCEPHSWPPRSSPTRKHQLLSSIIERQHQHSSIEDDTSVGTWTPIPHLGRGPRFLTGLSCVHSAPAERENKGEGAREGQRTSPLPGAGDVPSMHELHGEKVLHLFFLLLQRSHALNLLVSVDWV